MRNSLLGLACAVILLAPPAHGDDGVLIFGATRNTGLEIAKILVGRGEAVTAFVRPTSNLENLEPLDVDYFVGDALSAGGGTNGRSQAVALGHPRRTGPLL